MLRKIDEENVIAPLDDVSGVAAVLRACGSSKEQNNVLVGKGFAMMEDFLVIQAKDVAGMCTNLARIPTNQGGSKIGTVTMKKTEALMLWCHIRDQEGRDFDANEFDDNTLAENVKKGQREVAGDQNSPEPPKGFKVLKWVSWVCKFETLLWQVKEKNEVPLINVIRKDRDPDLPFNSEEERQVHAVTQKGSAFRHDNARLWNKMQAIMSDTPAWTWISKFEGKGQKRCDDSAARALRWTRRSREENQLCKAGAGVGVLLVPENIYFREIRDKTVRSLPDLGGEWDSESGCWKQERVCIRSPPMCTILT